MVISILKFEILGLALILVPFIENINKFQNPYRRPIATTLFLVGILVAICLGIEATLPIEIRLTFGLF